MLRYIVCMSKRLFGGCWSFGCWAGEAGELHFFTFLCLEPATHLVRISWGKASPSSLFAYKVSAHKSQPNNLTINAWNWEKTTFTRQQTLGILTTQTGVWWNSVHHSTQCAWGECVLLVPIVPLCLGPFSVSARTDNKWWKPRCLQWYWTTLDQVFLQNWTYEWFCR